MTKGRDALEDLVGCLGPDKGRRVFVVDLEVLLDGALQGVVYQ